MKNSIINYSLILILTCCLGSTFLFISISLTSCNPIASGSGRVILAASFSVIFTFILGQKLPDNKRDWFFAFIYGVFFLSIPFSIIPYSLKFLDQNGKVKQFFAPLPEYFKNTIRNNGFENSLSKKDLHFQDLDNYKLIC